MLNKTVEQLIYTSYLSIYIYIYHVFENIVLYIYTCYPVSRKS